MNAPLLALAGALLLLVLTAGVLLVRAAAEGARLRGRIAALRPVGTRHGAQRPQGGSIERLVRGVGEAVRRSPLLSAETLRDFEATVARAGMKGPNVVALFIGAKVLLFLGLPAIGFVAASTGGFSRNQVLVATAVSAVLGLLGPDWGVRHIRRRHAAGVQRGLPDALDLMVICAEAGLGLETAIERVALEMQVPCRPIAQEFAALSAELRVLADRRQALINFGERSGLDSAKRFGATLAQTLQYGTPLAHALRVLASELRQQRLTQYEERAARLPVLLTLPMIMFILPCVFLVVGGPAVLRAMDAMAR
jgi:tight adherence protein C